MQNTDCKGYWVKLVYVGDFSHPDTYKCMNQQEYDTYTAQIHQEQYGSGSDGLIAVGMVGAFIVIVIAGAIILSGLLGRRKNDHDL